MSRYGNPIGAHGAHGPASPGPSMVTRPTQVKILGAEVRQGVQWVGRGEPSAAPVVAPVKAKAGVKSAAPTNGAGVGKAEIKRAYLRGYQAGLRAAAKKGGIG